MSQLVEFPLVVGTKENLSDYAVLITPDEVKGNLGIPFYTETVLEGENIDGIKFNGPVVFRTSKIIPSKKDPKYNELLWLERHLRMTQGFVGLGNSPFLLVLGKPTPNSNLPDISNVQAFIIPPGHCIFLHLGTWHDFPIAIKPFEITCLLLNSAEVVEALASMEKPGEMDFGDAYKLKLSKYFKNKQFVVNNFDAQKLCFEKVVKPLSLDYKQASDIYDQDLQIRNGGKYGSSNGNRNNGSNNGSVNGFYNKYSFYYGNDVIRKEISVKRGVSNKNDLPLFVLPVINIELFLRGKGGPSIQPHLNSNKPEVANSGWRDYGNKSGCLRLSNLFKELDIKGTVVMNSDLIKYEPNIIDIIKSTSDQWEVGCHGINNSKNENLSKLSYNEEKELILQCINDIKKEFSDSNVVTWLTPGFGVTNNTTKILMECGVKCLLDFVNDDVAYAVSDVKNGNEVIAVPYSLETNDISLCLSKNYNEIEYANTLYNHITEMANHKVANKINVVCLGLHTFIAGLPSRVNQLRRIFGELKNNRNVEFVTCSDVVNVIKNNGTRISSNLSSNL